MPEKRERASFLSQALKPLERAEGKPLLDLGAIHSLAENGLGFEIIATLTEQSAEQSDAWVSPTGLYTCDG